MLMLDLVDLPDPRDPPDRLDPTDLPDPTDLAYVACLKLITSPSATTYSLPSSLSSP